MVFCEGTRGVQMDQDNPPASVSLSVSHNDAMSVDIERSKILALDMGPWNLVSSKPRIKQSKSQSRSGAKANQGRDASSRKVGAQSVNNNKGPKVPIKGKSRFEVLNAMEVLVTGALVHTAAVEKASDTLLGGSVQRQNKARDPSTKIQEGP